MGTRSLTYFYENNEPFAAFYRQFDGYPQGGHGEELGKILAGITLVNGYQMGQEAGLYANGAGCLAAQIVAKMKEETGIGGIYLINPNPEKHTEGWQEYEYHIHVNTVAVDEWRYAFETHIECRDPKRVIFSGSFADFYKWAKNPKMGSDDDYVPVIKTKPVKASVYEDIGTALKSEIVEVTFEKADGSERTMVCTKDFKRIPEDKVPSGKGDVNVDPRLYKVFDLEKNDWRSFRDERVIDWQVVRK